MWQQIGSKLKHTIFYTMFGLAAKLRRRVITQLWDDCQQYCLVCDIHYSLFGNLLCDGGEWDSLSLLQLTGITKKSFIRTYFEYRKGV